MNLKKSRGSFTGPILFALLLYILHSAEGVVSEIVRSRRADVPAPDWSLWHLTELWLLWAAFSLIVLCPLIWGAWNLLVVRSTRVQRSRFVDAIALTALWIGFDVLARWEY